MSYLTTSGETFNKSWLIDGIESQVVDWTVFSFTLVFVPFLVGLDHPYQYAHSIASNSICSLFILGEGGRN